MRRVSIPGGKPLHEPRNNLEYCGSRSKYVSIPGGKPLHEPLFSLGVGMRDDQGFNPRREAPPRATQCPCSSRQVQAVRFNPRREAPPRATRERLSLASMPRKFPSLAGSPSTSHLSADMRRWYEFFVSIPGGKPLHEPHNSLAGAYFKRGRFQSLAGSPSTTHVSSLPDCVICGSFQSLAGSPSTSHHVGSVAPHLMS